MGGFFSKVFGKKSQGKQELADDIFTTSMVLGQSYITNNGHSDEDLGQHVNEFIYFFLHMVNRGAFSRGGKFAQEAIYDEVTKHIFNKLMSSFNQEQRGVLMGIYIDGIVATEKIYGNCKKFTPDGEESMESTLLWEATKRVSRSNKEQELVLAAELISAGLETLKINSKIDLILKNI